PSRSETWGLVVNEALATGLPCVVSESVGCAPDLVVPGVTGATHPVGNVAALADALARLRESAGAQADACLQKAREYSFGPAAAGLVAACRSAVS
ncbi:MAG TPA: glycosyltransferase, partial [Planctomycetia bacterium]|nr:glycosyltransferase [Planctomycetia bacterium]